MTVNRRARGSPLVRVQGPRASARGPRGFILDSNIPTGTSIRRTVAAVWRLSIIINIIIYSLSIVFCFIRLLFFCSANLYNRYRDRIHDIITNIIVIPLHSIVFVLYFVPYEFLNRIHTSDPNDEYHRIVAFVAHFASYSASQLAD